MTQQLSWGDSRSCWHWWLQPPCSKPNGMDGYQSKQKKTIKGNAKSAE